MTRLFAIVTLFMITACAWGFVPYDYKKHEDAKLRSRSLDCTLSVRDRQLTLRKKLPFPKPHRPRAGRNPC